MIDSEAVRVGRRRRGRSSRAGAPPTARFFLSLASAALLAGGVPSAAHARQQQQQAPAAPAPKASPNPKASPATGSGSPAPPAPPAPPSPAASPSPSAAPAVPAAATPVAPTPTVVVVPMPAAPAAAAPAPEPAANNWVAGVLGLALLAGGGWYGLRAARQRGLTVADGLKKMGVEMPQDGAPALAAPLKPVAPPLPPLPSLTDLPSAGPAAASGVAAAVAPLPRTAGPRLVVLAGPAGSAAYELNGTFTIGRDGDNTLALPDDTTLSRRHARVESAAGGGWSLVDEGSSNGTYLNGRRVSGAQSLQTGDEIRAGKAWLRYEA